jgi:RNA polymerase sigma-70 factor, ECF subfamily
MKGMLPRSSVGDNRTSYGPLAQTAALDPELVASHRELLYRAAWRLCRSHHEAEDLVQEMFARVLMRPRRLRRGHEVGYLLRALRNTHANRCRAAARRPFTVPLPDADLSGASDIPGSLTARDVLSAIAGAPEPYGEAVVAIDLLGLSYEQAASHLRTNKGTITSRVARGRQRVARSLGE